jgi:hypothetical protein
VSESGGGCGAGSEASLDGCGCGRGLGIAVEGAHTQRTLGATVCVAQYDACGLGANDLVTLDQLVLAIPIDEVDVDVRWPVVAEEREAVPEPYQPRSPGAPCT